MTELAPIDAEPDTLGGLPEPKRARQAAPAPVFPTEADAELITAELLDKRPELAQVSHHLLTREVQTAIRDNAERIVRARTRQRQLVIDVFAPVFPSDEHAAMLLSAIPTLTDDELRAVIAAGYEAYAASIERGEPVTDPAALDAAPSE